MFSMTVGWTVLVMMLFLMQFSPFYVKFNFLVSICAKNQMNQYFQNSKDPIIAKVYRNFIEPQRRHLPRSTMTGLNRLCTETKYSCFCAKILATPLLKYVPCKVTEIPEMSYTMAASMIISKRSPYKKFLNRLWVHTSVIIITLNYE
jgi:hypothetical protein